MQTVLDQLQQENPGALAPIPGASRPDQLYAAISIGAVPAVAAALTTAHNARLVTVFAEDRAAAEAVFYNYYVFERPADPCYLVLRAAIPADDASSPPHFPSLASSLPSVNWQEREIQDWFGLRADGHPNPRRAALHDHWPAVHPLRKDFPLRQILPAFEGEQHVYRPTLGEGVFQIPVGPVHAGIIEPGHFNFAVAGEPILYLQLRMFYTHKGTEKLFENVPIPHAVFLAESVSGDSAFSHATAFCQAVETATATGVPARAAALRTVCLELERIYNHIADIGAIATDVAFVVANAHAMRLKERVLRLNEELTGHRLLRGMACPGGVRFDWPAERVRALQEFLVWLAPEFDSLVDLIHTSSSTRDRLETTGILHPRTARDLGVVGIAGRASGFAHDLRRDFPHAAYDQVEFTVPVYQAGDVLHRLQVRVDEVRQSIGIIEQLASKLPGGTARVEVPAPGPGKAALGYVEGWRGEIFHWIRGGANGRLARCKIKDPSLQNWPALSEAILGNIIPDFPVVNKSFNLSYSGTDR